MEKQMVSNRPYLLKAFYDWIVASDCTPYLVINAELSTIDVPRNFIEGDRIVLNVSPRATRDFSIDVAGVSFRASFSGREYSLCTEMDSILAVYAMENGQGIVFEVYDTTPNVEQQQPMKPKIGLVKPDHTLDPHQTSGIGNEFHATSSVNMQDDHSGSTDNVDEKPPLSTESKKQRRPHLRIVE